MKSFYIVFFMTLYFLNANSQPNYFQTGATWAYHTEERPEFPGSVYRDWISQFTLGGDTLINNKTYLNLHEHTKYSIFDPQSSGGPVISYYDLDGQYLRYDSALLSVYVYKDIDSKESLLYDFSLIVGDSVPGLNNFYVDSIETVSLFGLPTQKFNIIPDSSMSLVSSAYILEGIGSSIGLVDFDPYILSISSETYTNLVCFQLGNDVYPSGSSCDIFAGIEQKEQKMDFVLFYPNPAQFELNIEVSKSSEELSIQIINLQGQIVYKELLNNVSRFQFIKISTIAFEPGIYFVRLFDGKEQGFKKIIVE